MLGGVALSVMLQAAAACFGWPAMTAPFVLTTWSVQWLKRPPGARCIHGRTGATHGHRARHDDPGSSQTHESGVFKHASRGGAVTRRHQVTPSELVDNAHARGKLTA
ncbi:protein of unknown function [Paraburkholderia dioscoreae]|uniref:Uncharacterized protein n=1 Tax=Paraburkholderia dioscoreae TaxID=2604047 RepID=A0A5Q4ZP94_9BURK|nr:protein of unknown function [Paraburkholderia dioscoreae]